MRRQALIEWINPILAALIAMGCVAWWWIAQV